MALSKKFVSSLALAFVLAGCGDSGGGSVSSTPTPTPAPTPTPTPSPTPTPTPTANTSLLAPLVSESFVNTASRFAASYAASGAATGTANQQTGTISYNATTNSYSLTTSGGSITFGPGEVDSTQTDAFQVTYKKTSGSTTDFLTVTRPGTTGRVTYKYVGGAFWQRTVINGNTGTLAIDAMAYGVATPNSGVPTTGSASFAVDMIGAETGTNAANTLNGTGTAAVDFAAGTVVITGTFDKTIQVGQTGIFSGGGQLASGSNSFSGTFTFDDFGQFNGTLAGKFYGPAADEIGATFAASQSDGRVAAGTIIGRQQTVPANTSFNNSGAKELTNSQIFSASAARNDFRLQGASGTNNGTEAFSGRAGSTETVSIAYDSATDRYTIVAPGLTQTVQLGTATNYGGTNSILFSIGSNQFSPSSYSRMGTVKNLIGSASPTTYRTDYLVFGMPSPASAVPRTGSAGYSILVNGAAEDSAYHNIMNFSGIGPLWIDFGASQFRAKVPINIGEDWYLAGRAPIQLIGQLSLNGTLSSSSNGFSGAATLVGLPTDYTGTTTGLFFGPAAQEAGGTFLLSSSAGGIANGAYVGTKDANVTDPAVTLTPLGQLVSMTPLSFGTIEVFTGQAQPVVGGIAYQANTDTMDVTINGTPPFASGKITLSPLTQTGFDTYATTLAGDTYKAIRYRENNSAVALTYTGFGEFILTRGANESFWFRSFSYYGVPTPVAQIPRTGSASYSGTALAYANIGQISGTATSVPETGLYNVNGRSSMTVNWATQSFTANITSLFGERIVLDSSVPQLIFGFNPLTYTGSITGQSFATSGNGSHSLSGQFFGTNAAEFGATFFDRYSAVNQATVEMTGVITGKVGP